MNSKFESAFFIFVGASSTLIPLAVSPRVFFTIILSFIFLEEYSTVRPLQLGLGVLLLLSGAIKKIDKFFEKH